MSRAFLAHARARPSEINRYIATQMYVLYHSTIHTSILCYQPL